MISQMPTTLIISLFCLILYIIFCFMPVAFRLITGVFYLLFALFFMIFIYQIYDSLLYTGLTALGLFVFMYLIQIVIGQIIYTFKTKE